jgi:hypothetical protein
MGISHYPEEATMAEPKPETKDPEIHDLDLTQKLLTIANHSQGDPNLRATHAAARVQLAKLNKAIQDQVDKRNEEAAKAQAALEAKAVEDARIAKRKAEDEALEVAKRAKVA